MKKKLLTKRLEVLENSNLKKNAENKELLSEIESLEDKIYKLQGDKEALIKYVKKLRYMHSCAEDEVKRLNGICEILKNNIEAMNATTAQNDVAYYKLIEQNAFLAGEIKAYQEALPETSNAGNAVTEHNGTK